LNVSYTKIYAPADGVVIERRVDRGQTVQASMTAPSFSHWRRLTELKLTALADEAEIGRIRRGMKCASPSMRRSPRISRHS
jgi:HlyD family secretion protein